MADGDMKWCTKRTDGAEGTPNLVNLKEPLGNTSPLSTMFLAPLKARGDAGFLNVALATRSSQPHNRKALLSMQCLMSDRVVQLRRGQPLRQELPDRVARRRCPDSGSPSSVRERGNVRLHHRQWAWPAAEEGLGSGSGDQGLMSRPRRRHRHRPCTVIQTRRTPRLPNGQDRCQNGGLQVSTSGRTRCTWATSI